ncbi:MAG: 30S ribosomal protein S16 [Clostridia bacterium]|nr:30S ribosomal protein S16 [Deltaproteobacteria bacterium]
MAVVLRMTRRGTKKRPFYHVVAADSRAKRDGHFLEQLGTYNPLAAEASLVIDAEKAQKWLAAGAQTSPVVKQLLKRAGVK